MDHVFTSIIYCAVKPPSTVNVAPFVKDDASEQSHKTASATSSASPRRLLGLLPTMPSLSNLGKVSMARSTIAVRMTAGQTALTRIPLRAYSTAAERVSPTTPCLLAA